MLAMWHRHLTDYEATSHDQLQLKVIFFLIFLQIPEKKGLEICYTGQNEGTMQNAVSYKPF